MEPDLQLLRIVQTGLFLIHFPLAGVALGGSMVVLLLAVFGSPAEARTGRPLAADLAVRLLPAPGAVVLLVIVLVLALFVLDRLHAPPVALVPFWSGTLVALLAGMLLLQIFRRRVGRGDWRAAGLLCAGGGVLLSAAAYLALFWGLNLLIWPHAWPFLPGRPELWLSWNGLVGFLQFAALSLAMTGAALLRSSAVATGTAAPAGSRLVVAGLLAWPPLLLLHLLSLPDNAASIALFVLLALSLLLAAAACLLVLPPRAPSSPLLMAALLALFLLWLAVGQLSRDQALAAPAGPVAPLIDEEGR